jgi:hypothetical protein
VEGMAVFLRGGAPTCLSYRVSGDSTWRTRAGSVKGFTGDTVIDATIERSASGVWTLNGVKETGLEDCEQLDLAFTPATNLPHVRQLALAVHQSADLPVAWLDLPCLALERLPQRYTRRTESTYWYEAPTVGYAAELSVSSMGFVHCYAGLWDVDGARG